jgi:NAD(P) transhydrogenase subunit beta
MMIAPIAQVAQAVQTASNILPPDVATEIGLYIFILGGFLGYHLITRVPPLLHTPLMSATNAIAAISLVGSLVVAGRDYGTFQYGWICTLLGCIAVTCSSTNAIGGFLITDRMLGMFKKSEEQKAKTKDNSHWFLLLGTIIVAGIIGFIIWYKEEHGGRGLGDQTLKYSYIVSAVMFILGLKGLSSPKWARRGMQLAALGMLLAVLGTLFDQEIVNYRWIILGFIMGAVIGGGMGLRIPMTAVPQRTALSHSLGALAACLVGIAEFILFTDISRVKLTALDFEVVVGALTFTGSLIATLKLQEWLPGRPIAYKGQNFLSIGTISIVSLIGIFLVVGETQSPLFYLMVGLAFLFGLMLVIPIGAADMPTVIALLNSYGGLADASMGFVLMNKIQIITGSLDGTSGFLLALLMCRAMNRSATNVLFGAFGHVASEEEAARAAAEKGSIRSITAEEVTTLFETAGSVIIVPGYGMAVAQAQHAVAELANILKSHGVDVKYAIHPVAGRMPGHMNVLLAEANVPYDQLHEMEEINPSFSEADIVLVVGANDVTNPAARSNKSSPLYGMPILEVDRAKSIIVLKRSMRPGFAGVDNELYYNEKCMMLFGDAKVSITKLISEMKALI